MEDGARCAAKSPKRDATVAELPANHSEAPTVRDTDIPTCRRDKVFIIYVTSIDPELDFFLRVNKAVAYELGLKSLWQRRWEFDHETPDKDDTWRDICRLSVASHSVTDRAARLAETDGEYPCLCEQSHNTLSKEQRSLPLAGFIRIYDHTP